MLKKVLFVLLIFSLTTSLVQAQINLEIVDIPERVSIEEEFELSVEIAMSASSTYYIKARAGTALNSMRRALTFNSSTKTWLSDTSAWTEFPIITTDDAGFWSGNLKVKIKEGSQVGLNLLLISLKEISTDKKSNSAAVEFNLVEDTFNTSTTNNSSDKNLKVLLNEFSPAPDGNREWVEIYNPNSLTVDLTGWQIDDIPDGSSPFKIPDSTKIISKGYKIFYFSSKLNNSGDTLRLINSNGKVLEKFSYGKVEKGVTFAKDSSGKWKITTTPTPGRKNTITSPFIEGSPNSTSDSPTPSKSFIDTKLTELTDFPDILGITIPDSFEAETFEEPLAQTKGVATTNPNRQASFSAILVGIGLILVGVAVGLPLLKREDVEIGVNGD